MQHTQNSSYSGCLNTHSSALCTLSICSTKESTCASRKASVRLKPSRLFSTTCKNRQNIIKPIVGSYNGWWQSKSSKLAEVVLKKLVLFHFLTGNAPINVMPLPTLCPYQAKMRQGGDLKCQLPLWWGRPSNQESGKLTRDSSSESQL